MSLMSSLAAAVTRIAHPGERGRVQYDAPADGVPDAFQQLLTRPWRAQPEDTVGGWCITLAADPRTPSGGALAIAMFLSRDLASHIAAIHNDSLTPPSSPTSEPDPGSALPRRDPESALPRSDPESALPRTEVVGASVPRQGTGSV